VQEDNEVSGPAVKNPVELRPIVAAQLAQRAADLARVREGERWCRRGLTVKPVDLKIDRWLLGDAETVDEVIYRL
jgi:hypothetical protein